MNGIEKIFGLFLVLCIISILGIVVGAIIIIFSGWLGLKIIVASFICTIIFGVLTKITAHL